MLLVYTYYCDTQKQSSGEFAKFTGKKLCRSLFFSCRPIKKETLTQCSLRTLPEDCSENQVFFQVFLAVRYTHLRSNYGTFWERFIFQIIGLLLLFMSGFHTMKPRHADKYNRTKQRLYWQSNHASVSITKSRNFSRSFFKVFVV